MEGPKGQVSIQLAENIRITGISVEHSSRSSAAPRDFEVDFSSRLEANLVYTLNSIQYLNPVPKGLTVNSHVREGEIAYKLSFCEVYAYTK